ncbi:protein prenylyltransferase [Meira miltonrushii]|uniref:Pre-mRNA-splicing factor SYF1 n=1 Tax=Meira miltonrushii TaxID=1280837 RepID=A0A316VAP6_9BASI|nr:protein prenylyltransferase [Meira miltonrushii]PWN34677.1 protein prenylyltransferase [Meira miltonrushii]
MAPKRGRRAKGAQGDQSAKGGDAEAKDAVTCLTELFAVAHPFPDPLKDEELIPAEDVGLEQDLLLNLTNPRSWNAYLEHIVTSNRPSEREVFFRDADTHLSEAQVKLLGPLASGSNRLGLRRITFAYERAINAFPTNYNLWKDYLLLRMRYVLGDPHGGMDGFWKKQIRLGKEKLDAGPTLLDGKDQGQEEWQWGLATGALEPLDGRIGYKEWHDLAAVFERALMHLPTLPRIWQLYFTVLMHPSCPPTLSFTHTRRTFDRALRTLPPSLHLRVWKYYLRWAETRGSETCIRVWRRYLRVDPSLTERYVQILERLREEEDDNEDEEEEADEKRVIIKEQRAREAVKLLLGLARDALEGKYISPEGKSSYQLLIEWLSLCEKYADEVGLDPNEDQQAGTKKLADSADLFEPLSTAKLPVAHIVRTLGLDRFPDQAGRLWTGLATYWIRRGDLDAAKSTFEEGMRKVMTVRDFTQIFDAYAETSENIIGFMMDELGQEEEEGDEDNDQEEKEADLDKRMKDFEELMERRPFLVNDVMIRRNPNDVQEWEKRASLFGEDDAKVVETYDEAIATINPRKATANLHQLFVNFARFYEERGNIDSARKIMEKATTVPFTKVDDLAEVWCEWAELEVRNGNFDGSLRIMSRATAAPKTGAAIKAVSFLDDSLSAQKRLFKSSKLWTFYIDLEESIGSVESARQTYDRMIELKIATPQVIVNYAVFLEDRKYFEEAFRVYERGVEAFTYPVVFEIWNIYLSKFINRFGASKLERARDMFEQALEKCPDKYCRPLFLMYGKLEEDYGLAKRAMSIYERATERVLPQDKFNMYVFYIAKVAANFGLAATRPVYERAIETLPDRQTADMCVRFAQLERKLGEIDRARALYAHASQFCDPRTQKEFWAQWNAFEIEHGSEDTFREMLRIRRSVQAQFNTDTSYIAAYATAQQRANEANATQPPISQDPMAQAEQEAANARTFTSTAPMFVAAKQTGSAAQAPVNGENVGDGDDDSDLM